MEGQDSYGPGSWGITHLSCKLSGDTDVQGGKKDDKPTALQPALSLSSE